MIKVVKKISMKKLQMKMKKIQIQKNLKNQIKNKFRVKTKQLYCKICKTILKQI